MLLFWRKFLFYILLAAYLVLTPYAILYALGYMVAPSRGELFNKTGLLSIESEPKGARIFVDGKKFSQKTPSAVRDLLPGEYKVEVFKKGFDRWSERVSIYSEKATRLESVILLPLRPDEEKVSDRAYEFFLPLMIDFRVFALSTRELASLKGTDIFLKRTFDVGEKAGLGEKNEVNNFHTKGNSGFVLFDVSHDGKKSWEALQLNGEKEARSLDSLMPEHVDLFDWDVKSPERIYFLKDNILNAVNWQKQKLYAALMTDVLGFGVKGGRLYVLKKDWSLWVSSAKPENLKWEAVEDSGILKPENAGLVKWMKIEVYKQEFFQKDLMLFLSDEGMLLSSRAPSVLAESGVRGFQYTSHTEDEKIIFWTGQKISTVIFPKDTEENEKNPAAITVLNENGKDIRQAFWAYEASHVLFRDGDGVFLAELRSPERARIMESRAVMKISKNTPIFYHDLTHFIYYLHPETRHLMRRKITES